MNAQKTLTMSSLVNLDFPAISNETQFLSFYLLTYLLLAVNPFSPNRDENEISLKLCYQYLFKHSSDSKKESEPQGFKVS